MKQEKPAFVEMIMSLKALQVQKFLRLEFKLYPFLLKRFLTNCRVILSNLSFDSNALLYFKDSLQSGSQYPVPKRL